VTIIIEARIEALLRERAHREGRDVDAVANDLLTRALEREADSVTAIEESFAAARAGLERPLSAVIAEKRSRFALPELPQGEEEIRRAGDLP
jgi:hypothetical protein